MTEFASHHPPTVVVGVDGSECSKQALRWGAYVARTTGARVEAVTAWHFPPTFGFYKQPPTYNPGDHAYKALTETVDEVFGAHRPPGLCLKVREGNAPRVLLHESEHAAMLVVGSRGHGGFRELLLGSVSASVTEHASCPVLVVHGDEQPPSA